jgi:16S rRNA C1402 N4-methylase RsmH
MAWKLLRIFPKEKLKKVFSYNNIRLTKKIWKLIIKEEEKKKLKMTICLMSNTKND